jgi:hypothetical protein
MVERQRKSPVRLGLVGVVVVAGLLGAMAAPGGVGAVEPGQVAFAVWGEPGKLTVPGDLDGVGVTLEVSETLDGVGTAELSGAEFDPPGAADTPVVEFSANSQVTITFDAPVENLLLYTDSLRRATYTLTASGGSGSWSVQSGLENLTLGGPGGNVLSPPADLATDFTDGVLRYSGTLTELVINSSEEGSLNFSAMGYTLAVLGPEPPPTTSTTQPATTSTTSPDAAPVTPRYTG